MKQKEKWAEEYASQWMLEDDDIKEQCLSDWLAGFEFAKKECSKKLDYNEHYFDPVGEEEV